MGHLLYIFSILFFVGLALISQILLSNGRIRKYKKVIIYAAIVFFIGSFTDSIAHRWNVWGYGVKHTLHFRVLGTEIETIMFCVGTGLVVTIATLLWAEDVDNGRSPNYALKVAFKYLEKIQKDLKITEVRVLMVELPITAIGSVGSSWLVIYRHSSFYGLKE